ncbi:AAA family ATPase [Paraliomyxa miuraensis]|uniref:AAA family ATPase n=1 Tax=Paraliomyxa miuraensis TaxID=376150 RepID=UPI0022530C8C|nr:MoxR family ATPase [Paraliomyxa miuraensis]MCX4240101.1 MoxR family ATPase [Paraliomyxa miuraensis]
MSSTDSSADTQRALAALQQDLQRLVAEVQRVIVGQDRVIEGVVTCLLAGGHGLLEGVPGLGKTLLIRTLAQAVHLDFARIQFTPDLMPADIVGTSVLVQGEDIGAGSRLEYQPGPIFANIVLADEINRATPKTQSALLEAMAEGTVTAGGQTRRLPNPFLVLATQNPLEMEGTYPLPEAQLDRFIFKIRVDFPGEDELMSILDRTTGAAHQEVRPVLDGPRLLQMRELVRAIPVTESLTRYVVRVLRATHPDDGNAPELIKRFVRFGGSPRGAQAMLLAARVRCCLQGRLSPSIEDVRAVAPQALRHRVILNFEGEAEGVSIDRCLEQVLAAVPTD